MKNNKFGFTKTLLLTCMTIACLIKTSWAIDSELLDEPIGMAQAIEYKKQGDLNQAIKLLKQVVNKYPEQVKARVELAASYFLAHDFATGSVIFKKLLQSKSSNKTVKAKISQFINSHKQAIDKWRLVNNKLKTIKSSDENVSYKIVKSEELLSDHSNFTPAKLYLISLYLTNHQAGKAKHLIESQDKKSLTPADEKSLIRMQAYYRRKYESKHHWGVSASLVIGHDNNIGVSGNDGLLEDVNDSLSSDEDDYFYEAEEDEYIEDPDEGDYTEDFDDEELNDDEEFDDEEFEEEEFEEDEFEEDEFEESDKQAGLFTRLNTGVRYQQETPNIINGILVNTFESGIHAKISDRQYQDDIAQQRNYQVFELGAFMAKRFSGNSRLSLPFSTKSVYLDSQEYARYYDARVSYAWSSGSTRFNISEKLAYRDYQSFNPDRENARLFETQFGIGQPINNKLTFNGKFRYGVLNTHNQNYRSYDRFGLSGSLNHRINNQLGFTLGAGYKRTEYQGDFSSEINTEIEDEESKRIDDYLNYYIQSKYQLNKNWSIKGKISNTHKYSNQAAYEYDRTTISAGVYMQF